MAKLIEKAKVDRDAIIIRPFTLEDQDQVLQLLLDGFVSVGDRFFYKTIFDINSHLFFMALAAGNAIMLHYVFFPLASGQPFRYPLPITFLGALVLIEICGLGYSWTQQRTENNNYIKKCFEEDLKSIEGYYHGDLFVKKDRKSDKRKDLNNLSELWVACLHSHPNAVLGCIAMDHLEYHTDFLFAKHLKENPVPRGQLPPPFDAPVAGEVELRRMSVHKDYRRLGIGRLMMEKVIEDAINKKFERMIVMTTYVQTEAITGYKAMGFEFQGDMVVSDTFRMWYGALVLKDYAAMRAKKLA